MYPKFEKVDDHTIKIIHEKAADVSIDTLIKNRNIYIAQKEQAEQAIRDIDTILEAAAKLNITSTPIDEKTPEKEK